ncbi:TetR/AcrR family transcriptional regulator [Vibrio sp. PP-XX7]
MSISDQSRNVLKEQLLEAAASEFLEKGFSAASLDSIIKKAGGSKSKIYNYFGGKGGCLFRPFNISVS